MGLLLFTPLRDFWQAASEKKTGSKPVFVRKERYSDLDNAIIAVWFVLSAAVALVVAVGVEFLDQSSNASTALGVVMIIGPAQLAGWYIGELATKRRLSQACGVDKWRLVLMSWPHIFVSWLAIIATVLVIGPSS